MNLLDIVKTVVAKLASWVLSKVSKESLSSKLAEVAKLAEDAKAAVADDLLSTEEIQVLLDDILAIVKKS